MNQSLPFVADCNANQSVVNWEHFGPTDTPMIAISAHGEDAGTYVEAHHRGTYGEMS